MLSHNNAPMNGNNNNNGINGNHGNNTIAISSSSPASSNNNTAGHHHGGMSNATSASSVHVSVIPTIISPKHTNNGVSGFIGHLHNTAIGTNGGNHSNHGTNSSNNGASQSSSSSTVAFHGHHPSSANNNSNTLNLAIIPNAPLLHQLAIPSSPVSPLQSPSLPPLPLSSLTTSLSGGRMHRGTSTIATSLRTPQHAGHHHTSSSGGSHSSNSMMSGHNNGSNNNLVGMTTAIVTGTTPSSTSHASSLSSPQSAQQSTPNSVNNNTHGSPSSMTHIGGNNGMINNNNNLTSPSVTLGAPTMFMRTPSGSPPSDHRGLGTTAPLLNGLTLVSSVSNMTVQSSPPAHTHTLASMFPAGSPLSTAAIAPLLMTTASTSVINPPTTATVTTTVGNATIGSGLNTAGVSQQTIDELKALAATGFTVEQGGHTLADLAVNDDENSSSTTPVKPRPLVGVSAGPSIAGMPPPSRQTSRLIQPAIMTFAGARMSSIVPGSGGVPGTGSHRHHGSHQHGGNNGGVTPRGDGTDPGAVSVAIAGVAGELALSEAAGPPALGLVKEEDFKSLNDTAQRFNANLRLFKWLLIVGGLHQRTSRVYKWFLRIILWVCSVICLVNVFAQTASYRNVLFDIGVTVFHFWVAVSYEKWAAYLITRHWKGLMRIVNKHRHDEFSARINLIGWLAAALVPTVSVIIMWGWPVAIIEKFRDDIHDKEAHGFNFSFLVVHGVAMILIIVPWVSVVICSACLFYLVVLSHKADIDAYYTSMLVHFARGTNPEQYALAIRKHKPIRDRLYATSIYFQGLYSSFVVAAYLLLLSSAWNLARLAFGRSGHTVPYYMQDSAFFIVGIVALYFSLWTTSSLNSYWKSFISRINDLPHALNIQSLPHHTSLLIYYQTSETVYTVFGYDVTREAVLQFARVLVEIAAFTLVLAYFVN